MNGVKEFVPVLIPSKNVPEILRVLESAPQEATMTVTKNQISFNYEGVYLTSRVVEGVFPDYKQIIPKEHKTKAVLLKQDIVEAFKTVIIFSDKFNKLSVKVRPTEKKMELSTKNSDVGENVTAIEASVEGEDVDINFNYRYIADCFQSIESDSISFDFGGLSKPLMIHGINDRSFTYIVMPINK